MRQTLYPIIFFFLENEASQNLNAPNTSLKKKKSPNTLCVTSHTFNVIFNIYLLYVT